MYAWYIGHNIDKWIKSHFGHVISTAAATASTATRIDDNPLTQQQQQKQHTNTHFDIHLNWTHYLFNNKTNNNKLYAKIKKNEQKLYDDENNKKKKQSHRFSFVFIAVHIYMEFISMNVWKEEEKIWLIINIQKETHIFTE